LTALLAGALLLYSQTAAFAWDEGWHLLAAQLILRGKRIYLDFCYPQTPLNAYWNATWMRVLGESWRTPHAVAALMTTLAVLLSAGHLLRRFPVPHWRLLSAIAAFILIGLNILVFEFGTIGQAYGLALCLIVVAYRSTVAAVERNGLLPAIAAGFLASAATNATLLTAPVAPLLFLWMLLYHQSGRRWTKAAAFLGGGAIPCLPLIWFFLQSPRQTIFNIFEYHFFYRLLDWEGAMQHDREVLLSWIDSAQALTLILLAIVGLWYVMRLSGWERSRRAEFYLCAWIAPAVAFHISRAHPNFERYYLLTVPFLAILACAGLYAIGSALLAPDQAWRTVAVAGLLTCLGLAKSIYLQQGYFTWTDCEKIAAKVAQVTPANAMLLADEPTYFLTRHVPPSGMELADTHKLSLPPAVMAQMHVISHAALNEQIKRGVFDTFETSLEDDDLEDLGVPDRYAQKAVVADTNIFWGKR
jgi:hypothetical protein